MHFLLIILRLVQYEPPFLSVLQLICYIKDVVYHTKVKDKNDLKERINAAVKTIDEEMLKRTWTEIEYHLNVLHATNGTHIEIY